MNPKQLFNQVLFILTATIFIAGINSCDLINRHRSTENTSLLGSWELEKVTLTFPDTVIIWDTTQFRSIYFIQKKHFNFLYTDPAGEELIYAGYGRYSHENSIYIEHIEFHSISKIVGTSVIFNSKVEGNKWVHEGYIPVREEDVDFYRLAQGETSIHIREIRRRR